MGISIRGKLQIVSELQCLGQISSKEASRALLELTRSMVYQTTQANPAVRGESLTQRAWLSVVALLLAGGADPKSAGMPSLPSPSPSRDVGVRHPPRFGCVVKGHLRARGAGLCGAATANKSILFYSICAVKGAKSALHLATTARHDGLVDLFSEAPRPLRT